ncbi:MAG: redox-regulated ATPase YchF [Candidatus Eisenbacteria bacterium]|nr:redox-regulated ATPase YchF [Candidatus Eisenbacteria bacterium]
MRLGRQLGTADVPDGRVDVLSRMFEPHKTIRARVEYAEAERHEKKGGGTEVPEALRAADALVAVAGLFSIEDPSQLESAARAELADLMAETILSDQVVLESRHEKVRRADRVGKKPEDPREMPLLEKCVAALAQEEPLRALDFSPEDERLLRGYQLLSRKPLLVVLNVAEDRLAEGHALEAGLHAGPHSAALTLSAKVESEIVALSPEERPAFLEMIGLKEAARDRLLRASYDLLGLHSFFTVGKDEVRAWTVRKGAAAVEAAGVIHTDLARGFIRAEVISYAQMVEAKTLAHAREKGWLRLEGKEYVVQDGDILNIRFSV